MTETREDSADFRVRDADAPGKFRLGDGTHVEIISEFHDANIAKTATARQARPSGPVEALEISQLPSNGYQKLGVPLQNRDLSAFIN